MAHPQVEERLRGALPAAHILAAQAFSRTAGTSLVRGNSIRLLKDVAENYPAWLEAIRSAQDIVHFENYIFCDDDVGRQFADALIAKAREGARVGSNNPIMYSCRRSLSIDTSQCRRLPG
jgi:cardiolipin synthase